MRFSSFLSLVSVLFLYEYTGQKLDSTVCATSTKGELIHWITGGGTQLEKVLAEYGLIPAPEEPPPEDSGVGELEGHASLCFLKLAFNTITISSISIQPSTAHRPLERFPPVIAHSRLEIQVTELITFSMTCWQIDAFKSVVPLLCRVSMWA
jgi:hypothetical protein